MEDPKKSSGFWPQTRPALVTAAICSINQWIEALLFSFPSVTLPFKIIEESQGKKEREGGEKEGKREGEGKEKEEGKRKGRKEKEKEERGREGKEKARASTMVQ